MKTRSGIKKAIVGVVIAGAITITSLPGGVAHADGTVDAADYVLWRKSFDAAPTSAGIVDAADYAVWRSNFGSTQR